MVKSPVTTQARSSQPAEPTWRVMSAETMKMPEPIIDPATIIVESQVPSSRTKPVDLSSAAGLTALAPAGPVSDMAVLPLVERQAALKPADTTIPLVLSLLAHF